MKKIRVVLVLQIICVALFIGGVVYFTPKFIFSDLAPIWMKIFVGACLLLLMGLIIENGFNLYGAYKTYKRIKGFEKNKEKQQDRQDLDYGGHGR